METTNSYTNDKLEFRQIVLGHIKRICKEMEKESLGRGFVIEMQLRHAKKLFVALNLLLNSKDELVSDKDESEGSVE
jgi:hypothetical protein